MRKHLLSILAVVMVLGLTSCGKEDTATDLNVDLNRVATVQGKILINTDETISPARWSAPTSVKLIATVPYSSLNSGASGTYVIPQENINYGSDGTFTITAPVGVEGTAVTVKFEDFKGEVRVADGTGSKSIKVIWKSQTTVSSRLFPDETGNLSNWELNGAGYYQKDVNSGDDIN